MHEAVRQARQFAVERHGVQEYGGGHSYAYHLDAVAALLEPYGPVAQAAGYLHDVLEDTKTTRDELSARFGCYLSTLVWIVTDEPAETREERKALTYPKWKREAHGLYELALVVKAADRLANIQACLLFRNTELMEKYRREHAEFKAACHRPGLASTYWEVMEALMGFEKNHE